MLAKFRCNKQVKKKKKTFPSIRIIKKEKKQKGPSPTFVPQKQDPQLGYLRYGCLSAFFQNVKTPQIYWTEEDILK